MAWSSSVFPWMFKKKTLQHLTHAQFGIKRVFSSSDTEWAQNSLVPHQYGHRKLPKSRRGASFLVKYWEEISRGQESQMSVLNCCSAHIGTYTAHIWTCTGPTSPWAPTLSLALWPEAFDLWSREKNGWTVLQRVAQKLGRSILRVSRCFLVLFCYVFDFSN